MRFPRSFSLSRHYERLHINPRFVKGKLQKEIAVTDPNQPGTSASSLKTQTNDVVTGTDKLGEGNM